MEELLIQNARTYAEPHQLQLGKRLGFGIHGVIFVTEDNSKASKIAIKGCDCKWVRWMVSLLGRPRT